MSDWIFLPLERKLVFGNFWNARYFIHITHQECPFNCLGDELITIFSHLESLKHFCCSYIIEREEWDIWRERGGDISSAWFNGNNTHDRKWPDIKLLYIVYRVAILWYLQDTLYIYWYGENVHVFDFSMVFLMINSTFCWYDIKFYNPYFICRFINS